MRRTLVRVFVGYLMPVLISLPSAAISGNAAWAAIVVVDCSRPNHTITHALNRATGAPITIEVSGTCHENVVITVANRT